MGAAGAETRPRSTFHVDRERRRRSGQRLGRRNRLIQLPVIPTLPVDRESNLQPALRKRRARQDDRSSIQGALVRPRDASRRGERRFRIASKADRPRRAPIRVCRRRVYFTNGRIRDLLITAIGCHRVWQPLWGAASPANSPSGRSAEVHGAGREPRQEVRNRGECGCGSDCKAAAARTSTRVPGEFAATYPSTHRDTDPAASNQADHGRHDDRLRPRWPTTTRSRASP
jgi:hypothetical protein